MVIRGYPAFFNAETPECDNYSFGFWGHVPLLRERRATINRLVRLMNDHISAAVDRANGIWGSNSVLFVNPDEKFRDHRFCEPEVVEPDGSNDDVWLFLL